jgi:RHS repeat-associated protein
MSDGSLDTTEVAQTPSVVSPDETPSFSELAQNISEGNFSDQGAPYDIQQAVGYYLVDHSADAPLDTVDAAQADLQLALGPQNADAISADLSAYANAQLQFDPAAIGVTAAGAADPVNLGTGQFIHTATDCTVQGAGIDFSFVRTYKSGSFYEGPLGSNWDHSANQWIYVKSDQDLSVQTGQLRPVPYHLNSAAGAEYYVATGDDCIIVKTISGAFERHWPDGRVDQFQNLTGDGKVYQIVSSTDRFANYLTFNYAAADAVQLLSSVEVNCAQRVVQFSYDNLNRIVAISLFAATYWTPSGPQKISRQWIYQYDDFNDLVAVTGPATDTFPGGCTTQFAYSSASLDGARPHYMTAITDPNGDMYLENTFGNEVGTLSFGRVVRQRLSDGVYLFDWQLVVQDSEWTFIEADRPFTAVTMTQRNGHPIFYLLNSSGNVLLSRETILEGCANRTLVWRFAYDADGRQIAALSPEGRVTQTYYGREHYYATQYAGVADPDLPLPWQDPLLTPVERLAFPNALATVARGGFFDLTALTDDLAFLGDIFPSATDPAALGASDVTVKYTYEPRYQQRATASDPRYTTSADPGFAEPPSYYVHLTTTTFNAGPGATPASITYPTTTYPDGSPGVVAAQLTYDSYDARGRLLQYTDPAGNVFAQSYFPPSPLRPTLEGFLASRTTGVGTLDLVTTFRVNEAGLVVDQTDPLGNTTHNDFDARHLLRVVTVPLPGYVATTSYDGNAQVISTQTAVIDPGGTPVAGSPELRTVVYNAEMSPVLTRYGDSSGVPLRELRQYYDAANCLVRTVLPRGNAICYEYDERLLRRRIIRACCSAGAAVTAYEHDGDGQWIASIDARGNATRRTLDGLKREIAVIDPVGTLQRKDFDQLGNVTVQRWFGLDAPGAYSLLRRTEFLFDERGQLIRTRQCAFPQPIPTADPWGAPDAEFDVAVAAGDVSFYDSLIFNDGNLHAVRLVDAKGNTSTIAYDAANRRTHLTDAVGSFDVYLYDANSNVTRVDHCCADASGTVQAVISTGHEYDPLNRLVATTDGAGNRTQRGLDSRGLLMTLTDPLGHVRQWTYSPFRERTSESQVLVGPGGNPPTLLTTGFAYDANGNLVGVTDPLRNTTTTAYDLLDRSTLTTNPDLSVRSRTYDPVGNLTQQTDEDGVIIEQGFDPANRLVSVRISYGTASPPSAELGATMTYDGVDNLVAHENDFVAVTRLCDSLGRCYGESFNFAGSLNVGTLSPTIARKFDEVSNLVELQYPSGQVLQYSYTAAGRLSEIRSVALSSPYPGDPTAAARHTILSKQWWGDLQVASSFGNTSVLARAFDAAGRRIDDKCTMPGGGSVEIQELWDGANNRAVSIDANGRRISGWLHQYDSVDRLATVAVLRAPRLFVAASLAAPAVRPVVWTPNAQVQIDALIAGYVASTPPQLAYAYDQAGNRTWQHSGTATTTYSVNARNEYLSVGATALSYSFSGRIASDTRLKYFYNHRGQLVQARSAASGRVDVQVFHDALGRPILSIEGPRTRVMVPDGMTAIEYYDNGTLSTVNVNEARDRLCFFASGGRDQYVMRDVLESTRVTTDGQGRQTAFTRYDAFGALLGAVPATPIRYGGKYCYEALEWYDYLLRQYAPDLGRFVQPDPAGFVDGANLFTYVGNNPLSAKDPVGTERQSASSDADARGTVTDKNAPATDPSKSDEGASLLGNKRFAEQDWFGIGELQIKDWVKKAYGYATPDEAAYAALKAWNPISKIAIKELAGQIYRNEFGRYNYSGPVIGNASHSDPSLAICPPGSVIVGDWHTHGDFAVLDVNKVIRKHLVLKDDSDLPVVRSDEAHEQFTSGYFSWKDMLLSWAHGRHQPGYKSYLGTPSGTFLVYDTDSGYELPSQDAYDPAKVPTYTLPQPKPELLLNQLRKPDPSWKTIPAPILR